MPKINMKNFAINGRCYNVAATQTYYNLGIWGNPTYQWTPTSVNT